jgi:hypothetical protein
MKTRGRRIERQQEQPSWFSGRSATLMCQLNFRLIQVCANSFQRSFKQRDLLMLSQTLLKVLIEFEFLSFLRRHDSGLLVFSNTFFKEVGFALK